MRLRDKVIVIVGGTSGIGLSAARAFRREGAQLVVVGRDPSTSAVAHQDLGTETAVLTGDANEPATAGNALDEALRRFNAVHGVYHVAGGSGRRHGDGSLHELTDAGWKYTLDENLSSVFYTNRAAVRCFLRLGRGGSVLNIGSVLGFAPSPRHFGTQAYAAAKAAVIGLTRSAAACYAAQNIRFNVLAPGLVATPMSERAQHDPAILEFIAAKQPLDGGRIGQTSDLDSAAIYFMSDESRFVTGQVLAVDGGWSVSDGSEKGSG
jgi:NAD(P)-dependent dehydrogenase (short-subunit alcohol dehydrogenase family)